VSKKKMSSMKGFIGKEVVSKRKENPRREEMLEEWAGKLGTMRVSREGCLVLIGKEVVSRKSICVQGERESKERGNIGIVVCPAREDYSEVEWCPRSKKKEKYKTYC